MADKVRDWEKELKENPWDFEPDNEEQMCAAMKVNFWRYNHLYHIKYKSPVESPDGTLVMSGPFKANDSQRDLAERIWFRNVVPKARQRGITTFACIMSLDIALFESNVNCGIVAHVLEDAKKFLSDKVKFAYDRLPEKIKEQRPLITSNTTNISFSNGSQIVVGTSLRSGTYRFVHCSEFAKLSKMRPEAALEFVTGTLPAVPLDGIVIIESTAEGNSGKFFEFCMKALKLWQAGRKLNQKEYRLHFYSWWDADEYQMDPDDVEISEDDEVYFDNLEAILNIEINTRRRAWYIATRDELGDQDKMNQEFPSTVEEAFNNSKGGEYFTQQMSKAREQGRITQLSHIDGSPCMTFWDIGNSDGTAVWVVQMIGQEFRIIDFYEEHGEAYSHYVDWLLKRGYIYGQHFLPHDASHERQGAEDNKSPLEMLEGLMPGHRFEIVKRIGEKNWAIQSLRNLFPRLYFDQLRCKVGIEHLDNYKKKWSKQQQRYSDQPCKAEGHSEAADALMQLAQAYDGGLLNVRKPQKKRKRNWKTS